MAGSGAPRRCYDGRGGVQEAGMATSGDAAAANRGRTMARGACRLARGAVRGGGRGTRSGAATSGCSARGTGAGTVRMGPLRDIEITEALVRRGDAVPVPPPAAAEDGEPPRGPLATDLLGRPAPIPGSSASSSFTAGGRCTSRTLFPCSRTWGSGSRTSTRAGSARPARTGRRCGFTTSGSGNGARVPRPTSTLRVAHSGSASPGCGPARRRTTASTARPRPRPRLARDRSPSRLCEVPAAGPLQPQPVLHGGHAVRQPGGRP